MNNKPKIPPWFLLAPVQLCAAFDAHYTDSGKGEDFLVDGFWFPNPWMWEGPPVWINVPLPARYATARVYGPSGTEWEGQLDATGCTPVLYLATGDHSIGVSTILKRDTTSYNIVEVYQKQIDSTCPTTTLRGRTECEMPGFFLTPFKVSGGTSFDEPQVVRVSSGYDRPAFRVASVAAQMLSLDDNGLKANDEYKVYANSGCSDFGWREACALHDAFFGISTGVGQQDTTLEKFVIAHELGHQMQSHMVGTHYYDYTKDTTAPAACACDHVTAANALHCLQSRHDWSTAQTEGWAQFIAQRTFNQQDSDHCTFVYYKDVLDDSGVVRHPPYPVKCGEPVRWVENHCAKAGHSAEWDIMNFLRGLNAGGPDALTMTDIFGIYRLSPWRMDWNGTREAALSYFGNDASNPKYQRLLKAGTRFGVAN